ncbi:GNAT family N-acetyltransferase [soil metagenome]
MAFKLRKALMNDVPAIKALIRESVRGLSRDVYSERQIELSIESVFGVDVDLIADATYFVAEADGLMVGCGGWSKRKTLYGASTYAESRDSELLDPAADPAKIRAFFIHPHWARKGIGTAILTAFESEASALGFNEAEMMATLPGVKLYAERGYSGTVETAVPVGEGVDIVCIKMSKILSKEK